MPSVDSPSSSLTAEVGPHRQAAKAPATASPRDEKARLDALVALLAVGVVACLKGTSTNDEGVPDDDDELADDDGVLLQGISAFSNVLFEQAEPTDLEQEEEP